MMHGSAAAVTAEQCSVWPLRVLQMQPLIWVAAAVSNNLVNILTINCSFFFKMTSGGL